MTLPEENGEHITEKGRSNKVLTTNLTLEIQKQKVEGLMTYLLDPNLKLLLDPKTSNPDK